MVSNLISSNTKPVQNVPVTETNTNSPFSRTYWTYQVDRNESKFYFGTYVAIFLLTALASLILFIPLMHRFNMFAVHQINENDIPCGDFCRFELVETIPEGLTFDGHVEYTSTYDLWKNLITTSNKSIEIASFYWTLRENETYPDPSSRKGEEIYQALIEAGLKRNISIRIVQNEPSTQFDNIDTHFLSQMGAAEVRSLNFTKMHGSGVLHTKFWIFDRKHVYIGSANLDWRALTQVKELGSAVHDCPCVAEDLAKIFEIYWMFGSSDKVPRNWQEKYSTKYNADSPLKISINNKTNLAYISSAPPFMSAKGRTHDLDALLRTISNAKKFVYISVMDYFPLFLYSNNYKFWPVIDNEIRRAIIERGVNVKILISKWKHTRRVIYNFMNSLKSLDHFKGQVRVEVKKFEVPSTPEQSLIPFARVNHNKYMVTDNGVFIGTSNWSGDYFTDTGGVSFVMSTNNFTDNTLREQLVGVFERDWFSNCSKSIY